MTSANTMPPSVGTPTMPQETAIEVDDVRVTYGEVQALTGVTLQIPEGRVTGLIGMNGSGKSTLYKAIMGVVPLDVGTVRVGGETPARARARGLVGYVPQSEDIDQAFPISVREVVMMGRYGHQGPLRRPRPVDHRAIDAALERVELTDLADRQIGQLSGGQRKRAFVARGLAQGARILLLDEPFAGVDKPSEAMIVDLLRELAAEGCAIVVSTHDLHALPELADDVVLLLRKVLFHGSVAEALEPEKLALAFGLAS